MSISKRIFELIDEKGFTISSLSKLLNVSRSNVSYWKKTDCAPPAEMIPAIAGFLDVSITYLMIGENLEQTKEEIGQKSEKNLSADAQELLTMYEALDALERSFIKGKMAEFILSKEKNK